MWSFNGTIRDSEYEITVREKRITVFPFELVLCASLTAGDQTVLASETQKFPVVLDTGHTHNFAISEVHLRDLVQLEISGFRRYPGAGRVKRVDGNHDELPFHEGYLWLYSSDPNTEPLRIELDGGFTFYPDGQDCPGPDLPLLGARAMRTVGLQLVVNYYTLQFSVTKVAGSQADSQS